eukprot:10614983-Alexandrium_andersonii.AAC.1
MIRSDASLMGRVTSQQSWTRRLSAIVASPPPTPNHSRHSFDTDPSTLLGSMRQPSTTLRATLP